MGRVRVDPQYSGTTAEPSNRERSLPDPQAASGVPLSVGFEGASRRSRQAVAGPSSRSNSAGQPPRRASLHRPRSAPTRAAPHGQTYCPCFPVVFARLPSRSLIPIRESRLALRWPTGRRPRRGPPTGGAVTLPWRDGLHGFPASRETHSRRRRRPMVSRASWVASRPSRDVGSLYPCLDGPCGVMQSSCHEARPGPAAPLAVRSDLNGTRA